MPRRSPLLALNFPFGASLVGLVSLKATHSVSVFLVLGIHLLLTEPCGAQSQSSESRRVDSTALSLYRQEIGSILAADSLATNSARFSSSPEAASVAIALGLPLGSPANVILQHVDARVVETNRDSIRLVVMMQALVIRARGVSDSLVRELRVTLPRTISDAAIRSSAFVRLGGIHSSAEESSFWSGFVEPALVVLSGALIVALFFFVRS